MGVSISGQSKDTGFISELQKENKCRIEVMMILFRFHSMPHDSAWLTVAKEETKKSRINNDICRNLDEQLNVIPVKTPGDSSGSSR